VGQGLFLVEVSRSHTLGRTPLEEWSAHGRDPYLTAHDALKRPTSMPTLGFEPAIPTTDRPQTQTSDHAATGIGCVWRVLV